MNGWGEVSGSTKGKHRFTKCYSRRKESFLSANLPFKVLHGKTTSEIHQSAGCQDNAFPTYTCSLYSQVQEPTRHLVKEIPGYEIITNLNSLIFLSFWLQENKPQRMRCNSSWRNKTEWPNETGNKHLENGHQSLQFSEENNDNKPLHLKSKDPWMYQGIALYSNVPWQEALKKFKKKNQKPKSRQLHQFLYYSVPKEKWSTDNPARLCKYTLILYEVVQVAGCVQKPQS